MQKMYVKLSALTFRDFVPRLELLIFLGIFRALGSSVKYENV